jgi:trans-2,3-dihydro-3-hydroxyanthranilate isomerase
MTSTQSYRYRVVDVFTDTPLEGNPLAVFPDAQGLADATMQDIARELNLSETTFVLPATRPDCAALVRIFTPATEMKFAGHPTVGTSFVLLDEGMVPAGTTDFLLEEKIGPVPIRVDAQKLIWLRTPPIGDGASCDRSVCAKALGLTTGDLLELPPQILSAGNPAVFIPLRDAATVDRARLSSDGAAALARFHPEPICIFPFAPVASGAYSRMFAPDLGVVEDPATGSTTGPLAAYMMRHKLVSAAAGTRFVSEQGTKMKRRSILHVQIFGDNGSEGIDVGGHVAPLTEAEMKF